MKTMIRTISAVFLILLLSFAAVFSGCAKEPEQTSGKVLYLYYKDEVKRELHPVEAVIDDTLSFDKRLSSCWRYLVGGSDQGPYTSPVPATAELKSYTLDDTNLVFNFTATYKDLSSIQETILRAALVKTFTQFPEVETVEIRVENQVLARADGTIIGPERPGTFIDLFGSGLNAYTTETFMISYTNEPGDCLLKSRVEVTYSNAISPEQAVIEKLLQGPEESGYFPTIPSAVKLLSVTTKNGVCYVNLSSDFLKNVVVLKPEIAVYSIVNTLAELGGITSVQISVNGSTNVTFMDRIDLSRPLYRTTLYDAPAAQ